MPSVGEAVHKTWLGLGAGSDSTAARYAFPTSELQTSVGAVQESWYVKTYLELGVFGLAIVLALLGTILYRATRVHLRIRDPRLKMVSAAILALMGWVLIYCLKAQYFDLDPINVYFWLFAGMLMSLPRLERREEEPEPVEAGAGAHARRYERARRPPRLASRSTTRRRCTGSWPARPELDLTVYFYSDASVRGYRDREFGHEMRGDTPLLDGYRSRFLPSAVAEPEIEPVRAGAELGRPARGPVRRLRRTLDPRLRARELWLATRRRHVQGTRVLIREEQTLLHGRPGTSALKEIALRALFLARDGLYIGEENRGTSSATGWTEERLFPARYCVDNEYFRRARGGARPRRDELRARFGIEDGHAGRSCSRRS